MLRPVHAATLIFALTLSNQTLGLCGDGRPVNVEARRRDQPDGVSIIGIRLCDGCPSDMNPDRLRGRDANTAQGSRN